MNYRAKQAIAVTIGVVVGVGMIILGLWQTSRYQASMEDVAQQRLAEPAVNLAEHVRPDGTVDDVFGRRAVASGEFVPELALHVGTEQPMRAVQGFQLEDGRYLAVVLGVSEGEAAPRLPTGVFELEGIFTSSDPAVRGQLPADAPAGSLTSLRLQALAQDWPTPLIAGYITLSEEHSAELGLMPAEAILPEQEGTAMHQGYALQWWVFAGAAIVFSVIVARGFAPAAARESEGRKRPSSPADAKTP